MIQAIQTRYAGYLFRSRLEARWAVFFDALKLDWVYEPEGFTLPSGKHYLPDFRINLKSWTAKDHFLWVEVKPGDETSPLLEEFIQEGPEGWKGVVLHDIPDPRFVTSSLGRYYPVKSDRPFLHIKDGWDNCYRFCICPQCNEVGFEFDGRSARIGCGCPVHGVTNNGDKTYTPDHPTLVAAFAKARSARFEHEARERYATVDS